ncbi:MAG: hypothetical protein V9G20_24645 [Candidatus Promineifilaceae bacterium]
MTTEPKLTKRQKEVVDMMREGWSLQVRTKQTKTGTHKPLLIYWDDAHSYKTVKVSFTVIDALQKAHIIHPVKSVDNQQVWIYQLTDNENTMVEFSE